MKTVSTMDGNNTSIANEISVITSTPQTVNTNDFIDLTESNDCDESVETRSPSVIVSNGSVCPQRPPKNRQQISTNSPENSPTKVQLESKDDSICILYENVQPSPEVVFVNEVVIDGQQQSQSDDVVIPLNLAGPRVYPLSPNSPVVMGSFSVSPLPPLYPEISSERTSTSYQLHNYCLDNPIAPQRSSLPSCRYATVINERSDSSPQSVGHEMSPLSTIQVPLNVTTKVPKIQCGICLDGPDEIAASDRNFTSTNCGHVFCNTCIKTSMKNAAKCPKCRKKITSRSIHPLFL